MCGQHSGSQWSGRTLYAGRCAHDKDLDRRKTPPRSRSLPASGRGWGGFRIRWPLPGRAILQMAGAHAPAMMVCSRPLLLHRRLLPATCALFALSAIGICSTLARERDGGKRRHEVSDRTADYALRDLRRAGIYRHVVAKRLARPPPLPIQSPTDCNAWYESLTPSAGETERIAMILAAFARTPR